MECPRKKSGVVTVASGTAIVDEWVFDYCNDLTEIVIPDSVRAITDVIYAHPVNVWKISLVPFLKSGSAVFLLTAWMWQNWQRDVIWLLHGVRKSCICLG